MSEKRRKSALFSRTWISDKEFFESNQLTDEEWINFDSWRSSSLSCTYQVSNKGRVRKQGGPIIHGSISFDGYHEVGLCSGVYVRVHRLVLTLFAGGPPADMVNPTVQHINHDKLDNRIENLCWMPAFDNNQEGHGCKCKIIDAAGEHVFGSQKIASKYIGRYQDYISECIRRGYKLTAKDGSEPQVFTEVEGNWVQYVRSVPGNRTWCKLEIDGQIHDFESYQACSRFLGEPESYVQNMILNSWPISPKIAHKFYMFDRNLQEYVEYKPTKQKLKNFATKCQLTLSSGEQKVFASIQATALYLNRDPEWLRLAIRDNKVIRDSNGQVVSVLRLN